MNPKKHWLCLLWRHCWINTLAIQGRKVDLLVWPPIVYRKRYVYHCRRCPAIVVLREPMYARRRPQWQP